MAIFLAYCRRVGEEADFAVNRKRSMVYDIRYKVRGSRFEVRGTWCGVLVCRELSVGVSTSLTLPGSIIKG